MKIINVKTQIIHHVSFRADTGVTAVLKRDATTGQWAAQKQDGSWFIVQEPEKSEFEALFQAGQE